jgi:hypothetical protein
LVGGFSWTRRVGTIDFCPALAALVSPEQNIIFLTANFSTLLVPIAQQPGHWAGSRAGSPVSVSLGAGSGAGGETPPPPPPTPHSPLPYFPADPWIFHLKTKDDITVLLLLGVSFMIMRNECDHKEILKGTA